MILRQFDTEIGNKANHLDELKNELEMKIQNYQKWKNDISIPTNQKFNEMIIQRKENLIRRISARKIQKWWRKILKKRRREEKIRERKLKLEKQKQKFK